MSDCLCIQLSALDCVAEDKIDTFGQQINYYNWPDEGSLSSQL